MPFDIVNKTNLILKQANKVIKWWLRIFFSKEKQTNNSTRSSFSYRHLLEKNNSTPTFSYAWSFLGCQQFSLFSFSVSEKSYLEIESPLFFFYSLVFFFVAVREMCPLRFILVFFSAVLAGYFAWKTVRSDPKIEVFSEDSANEDKSFKKEDFDFKKVPS